MYINPVSNQSFESKKFRLIVDSQLYSRVGTTMTHFKTTGKYVREYSNPKAEELYKKAQTANSLEEKAHLYEQMGHYELKNLSIKEQLQDILEKLIKNICYVE